MLRSLATVALLYGYLGGRGRDLVAATQRRLRPERNWRSVSLGPLRLRVPPGWGETEVGAGGSLLVHNLPSNLRVDGDAVWYASAIELEILPDTTGPRPAGLAMTEHRRILKHGDEVLRLTLRIANGVAAGPRQAALRVLGGARLVPNAPPIRWASPADEPAGCVEPAQELPARLLPAHPSRVARDAERLLVNGTTTSRRHIR